VKRIKEIVAFAVLACLVLTSIQTVLADGTVTCPPPLGASYTCEIWGPAIAPGGGAKSHSPFTATFINVQEASVSLTAGTYTFTMTMLGTPSDWMGPGWQPTFASPHEHTSLNLVGYHWGLYDASGHFLGFVYLGWQLGTIVMFVGVCLPGASAYYGCLDSVGIGRGLGFQKYLLPPTMTPTIDTIHHTVSVAILKTDLDSVFLTAGFTTVPAQWRAMAAACQSAAAPTSGEDCTGYGTWPHTSLPT
jgi:hypothetical protein